MTRTGAAAALSSLLGTRRRRAAAAAGLAALLLVPLALAAATAGAPARVALGDRVTYHVTVLSEDGRVLLTTDAARARVEHAAGNPLIKDPDVAPVRAYERDIELTDQPWDSARFLLGRAPGDTFRTPLMKDAFGPRGAHALPLSFGPMPITFDVDLDAIYSAEAKPWVVEHVARSAFVEGARIPYGTGLATQVVALEGALATLRIELPADADAPVPSSVFGFAFRVERVGDDQVTLHALLEEGQEFTTAGCKIPDGALAPGTYAVGAKGESTVQVLEVPTGLRAEVVDRLSTIEYTVLAVERPPRLAWLANAVLPEGLTIIQKLGV